MRLVLAKPARLSWLLLAAMALAALLFQWNARLGISPGSAGLPLLLCLTLASSARLARPCGAARVEAAASAFLQMTLFTLLGLFLSYAITARAGPLWDAQLSAADRALGLDWPMLRGVLDKVPPAVWVLGIAYHSLIAQMVVVIVGLAALGRFDALRLIVCAAIGAGFACILVSALVPASGNAFDPDAYHHLWPPVARLHADIVTGLRTSTLHTLDLTRMMGIVTFPSFHAALALIFIWSFRRIPRLAAAGSAWAALTIVATPVFGGHYAVDVIAGLVIGAGSLAGASRLFSAPAAQATLQVSHSRPPFQTAFEP
jgi:hypothetical protein